MTVWPSCLSAAGVLSRTTLTGTGCGASVPQRKTNQRVRLSNSGNEPLMPLLLFFNSPSPLSVFLHSPRRLGDPCRLKPCQNGGDCRHIPDTLSFECLCAEGFAGRLCEQSTELFCAHFLWFPFGMR